MANSERLPYVSLVIPAYNEEKYLPLCLESIRKQDYPGDYETIVVDNASTDNTAQIALAVGAKVTYESSRSPACARQRGLEAATGDIVAFIDADSQAPSYWLSTFVSRFVREPETVVLAGSYAFFDAGSVAKVVSYAANFVNISLDHLFRKALNKGGALWGSNFAARRSALLAAGGFDTSIRFFGEEYELSLRLKHKGKAGLIPWLFVLTSARRLKEHGLLTTYWNYIVDYFSVLFWHHPISERLESWPARAWQHLATHFSWRRVGSSLKYLVPLLILLWLHFSPLLEASRWPLYAADIVILGTVLMYHAISPASRLYGKVLSNGNRNHHQIALTFDDGPNEPYTSQVLDILRHYGIKATFFFIGQNVQRHPEACRQALAAGHVLGNHSHHHYRSLCLKQGKAIAHEVHLAHQAVYHSSGYQAQLFRPPHGFRTPWLIRTAQRLGYRVVTWDVMTDDWHKNKSAKDIFESIVNRARPGSIIVLHDGRGTRENYDRSQMLLALPRIIEALKNRGFEFVTVPEMLGLEATPSAQ